jgi:hypothetical protein
MSIITYCDACGILVRSRGIEDRVLCPDCRAGREAMQRPARDSGRIPYSQIPSPESILEVVQATVRRGTRRATPCAL